MANEMEIVCSCGHYDYDPPTIYEECLIKARKTHVCCECCSEIKPGTLYQRVKGLWDGSWETYATCLGCSRMRDDFCNPPFGYLRTAVDELIKYDYVAGE